jgi:hypothetical protein
MDDASGKGPARHPNGRFGSGRATLGRDIEAALAGVPFAGEGTVLNGAKTEEAGSPPPGRDGVGGAVDIGAKTVTAGGPAPGVTASGAP